MEPVPIGLTLVLSLKMIAGVEVGDSCGGGGGSGVAVNGGFDVSPCVASGEGDGVGGVGSVVGDVAGLAQAVKANNNPISSIVKFLILATFC